MEGTPHFKCIVADMSKEHTPSPVQIKKKSDETNKEQRAAPPCQLGEGISPYPPLASCKGLHRIN